MNLPNKLTLFRCILVPVFMALLLFVENIATACICSAAVFAIASLTDMLDGKIARKYNLITNFGKFMDPLADKLLVFGALLCVLVRFEEIRPIFVWVAFVVIFRELAVTSMRLLVAGCSGEVIAAKMIGKIKTVIQMAAILVILLEPAIQTVYTYKYLPKNIFSYVFMAAMALITVISGISYFKSYWPHISHTK